MRRLLILPLAALSLSLVFGQAPRGADDDPDGVMADELVLKNAYLATDGKSLVAFLSTRARGEATAKRLDELITGLESKTAAERQKAVAELVSIGSPAIPALRRASRNVDNAEAAALARRCLKALEEDNAPLTSAAVRILAARRPVGTAKALLDYLPHAESETVLDELRTALAAVAFDKGAPNSDVIDALSDEHPVRRAGAVVALCSRGTPEPRDKLRKLLGDPAPSVRLKAGLALAQASDSKAVSTLILLLADLPAQQATEVETVLQELAGELGPKVAVGPDQLSREKARDAWAKWWVETEGDGLLAELKRRTLTEKDMQEASKYIEQLGDDAFSVRQKAETKLKGMGANIVPLLRAALKSEDLEIRNRSAKCLESIEANKPPPLSPTTAKLIALRKPKGAAETLLGFMPFIEEEGLHDELQLALNAVAFTNGKADPVILKGVTDKNAIRRAAAGAALASVPLPDHMPAIRRLLKDRDNDVRLKVAVALAGAREQEAVPALVALVGEHNAEGSAQAEDLLVRLAGNSPPKGLPEGDDNRKKRSEMWGKWYAASKNQIVWLDPFADRERYLGFTLLCYQGNGWVVEWDKAGKERWKIQGLTQPWDAKVLPNGRVLICEYNAMQVTERDTKGKVLWTKRLQNFYPMSADRLRNGNTFIACTNLLVEVDRSGKEVWRMDRPQYDVRSARKLPNGEVVLLTSNRQIIRLDAKGKEKKTVTVQQYPSYYQNEILNNGNVLMPTGWNNQGVIEYDKDGKEVSKITAVQNPMHATRLPNGNTLIVSGNNYQIFEIDKKGKQVGTWNTQGQYLFRARRR